MATSAMLNKPDSHIRHGVPSVHSIPRLNQLYDSKGMHVSSCRLSTAQNKKVTWLNIYLMHRQDMSSSVRFVAYAACMWDCQASQTGGMYDAMGR